MKSQVSEITIGCFNWECFFAIFPIGFIFIYTMNVNLICNFCSKPFQRSLKRYNVSKKRNKSPKLFCSRECHLLDIQHDPVCRKKREENTNAWRYDISKHANNGLDKYSAYKVFIRTSKTRSKRKNHICDLDAEYLMGIWKKQNGICPYSGLTMVLPHSTFAYNKIKSLKKASLDRIDSSKGYIKGNVQFVCEFINFAKQSYTHDEMIEVMKEMKVVRPVGVEPTPSRIKSPVPVHCGVERS